jgi:hypothetical protein
VARTAFAISTLTLAGALGCGGRENGADGSSGVGSGASAAVDASDGGADAVDIGPDAFASGTCSAGTLSCQGLQPQTCVGGPWQNSGTPCPYVCGDGTCSGVCVPLTGYCEDVGGVGLFKSCGLDGQWNPDEACDAYFPPPCDGGNAALGCVPGDATASSSESGGGDGDGADGGQDAPETSDVLVDSAPNCMFEACPADKPVCIILKSNGEFVDSGICEPLPASCGGAPTCACLQPAYCLGGETTCSNGYGLICNSI